MNMKKERIYPPEVLWVKEHQEMLNIYQLEKQVGMSMNLLRDFLKGTWGLHERWWEPVIAWVRAFTKMPADGTAAPIAPKSEPTKTTTNDREAKLSLISDLEKELVSPPKKPAIGLKMWIKIRKNKISAIKKQLNEKRV